ncbi:MAG TPA: hypothetical protein VLT79_04925 [Gemmatimonadales bacterium]|nr:hypothetical protein [Gemmatimonadales bacterium]
MPLRPIYGHDPIRSRLGRAILSHTLPQTLLLVGRRGVGKQRLALWIAQALLCERRGDQGAPCGTCSACAKVTTLAHPDLHWFVPVEVTKKGADADKQVDLVEEALWEEMAARRAELWQAPAGMASHSIASVRLLARSLQLTPAMGRYKVFIVGDAERLTPQKGNPEAANALLKALEEPPQDAFILLTSSDPDSLLPTILSRMVRVSVSRLPDSVMTEFAQLELETKDARRVESLVRSADGSIGRMVELANGGSTVADGNAVSLETLLERGGSPVERYARALAQTPFQARGGFTGLLDGLLVQLRARARRGGDTQAVVAAIAQVLETRELAQGNVNPQLLTALLGDELESGRGGS